MPNPKLKYQQLLAYAKELPLLPADLHTEDHKVRGCVSQVGTAQLLAWPALCEHVAFKGLIVFLPARSGW